MIDRDVVRKALSSIQRRSEYEYFFSKLSSPDWIAPLYEEGYFKQPPLAVREGDYIRFPSWPEGEFLARVASAAPEQAARVLLKVETSDNALVHSVLVDIALKVPIQTATKWAAGETQWIVAQPFLALLLPEKFAELAARLAQGGEAKVAARLSKSLLEVLPDSKPPVGEGEYRLPPRPRAKFDAWEYSRVIGIVLGPLIDALGGDALDLFSDLLDTALLLSSADQWQSPDDYSFIWRDAIESSHEDSRDLREALVSAVRDAATRLAEVEGCAAVLQRLKTRPWKVYRRIEVHLIRVSCDDPDLVRETILSKELFDDASTYHEYAMLVRDKFSALTHDERLKWLAWISAGKNREGMRQRHLDATGEEIDDKTIESWNEQWQRDRLSPARDALPTTWREYFEELVARHGPPEFDFALHRTTVGWGVPSPINRDELAALSPREVREFLTNWKPHSESPREPSQEGLLDTLRGMDEAFYVRQAAEAVDWQELPPEYIAALFSGAQRAVKSGRRVAWPSLLELAEILLSKGRSGNEWEWLSKTIGDLLLAGFEAEEAAPPISEARRIWNVLAGLAAQISSETKETPVSEEVDSLTVAINSVSGRTLEAIIRYAIWIKSLTFKPEKGWHLAEELPQLAAVLERMIQPAALPLVDARAIFGLQLGPMMWLDQEWVTAHRHQLFPRSHEDKRAWSAVWNTFLIYGTPFKSAIEDFRHEYQRSVEELKSRKPQRAGRHDVDERLAEHLMTYYWQGALSRKGADRTLDMFFESSEPKLRASAIEFIGRSLKSSSEVPAQPIRLLRDLFEWRLDRARDLSTAPASESEELVPFGWWFSSGHFDPEWSLAQLAEVLRLAGRCEPDHMVAEQLVVYVEKYPIEAGEALKAMIEGLKEIYSLVGWRDEAKQIVRVLLRAQDKRAQALGKDIIDALIQRRFVEFRSLLTEEAGSTS